MNYLKLREFKNKLLFKVDDIVEIFNISIESARVLCSRYTKKGYLIRLKKNLYILPEKWENLELSEYFKIANFLQVPSYISFMTALTYYEISTQVQRNFIESICFRRSKEFEIQNVFMKYYKINKEYYSGFRELDGFFIAEKEKAFIDSIYFSTFGKYSFDISSINLNLFSLKKINEYSKNYPERVKANIKKIWKC